MSDAPLSEPEFATADTAQDAFYAAFNAADATAMMRVWADDAIGVECIHPMSDRITSRDAIEASWRQIFASGARLEFAINDVAHFDAEGLAVRVVHEDIRFGSGPGQRSRVIATNVYRQTYHGWRIVLHHGSPGTVPASRAPTAGPLH